MDKIKNILNPGSKKDDAVMYGSGQSTDPTPSSGPGSDLNNSRTTGNPTIMGGDDRNLTSSTRDYAGTSSKPSKAEQVLGSEDPMGGVSTQRVTPMDDVATTASVKSGVPGEAQSGKPLGSETDQPSFGSSGTAMTAAGPHSSNLANKVDPRVDSDRDGRGAVAGTSSTTSVGSTGIGQRTSDLPDRSVGSTGYGDATTQPGSSNLARDAALGAGALGAGGAMAHQHGHDQSTRHAEQPGTERSFPLMGGAGASRTAAAEPHHSSLANKADPRVDSDLDGSRRIGATGTTGATGTMPTAGIRSQATGGGTDQTLPRGYGAESWEKGGHSHDFQGDPCHGTDKPVEGVIHHTKGPHSLDIANALDPHVGTNSGGIGTTTSGIATGLSGGDPSLGTSKTSTGKTSALTSGEPSATSTTQQDSGLSSGITPLTSTTDRSTNAGQSATGLKDTSKTPRNEAGMTSQIGPSTTSRNLESRKQHDPALTATTASAGMGASAGAIGSQHSEPTRGDDTLTGPVHKSSVLNKLDPRVKSVSASESTPTSGMTGSVTTPSTHKEPLSGNNAHLGAAGAAAGGGTAFEVGKEREGYKSEQYPLNEPTGPRSDSLNAKGTQSGLTSGAIDRKHPSSIGSGGAPSEPISSGDIPSGPTSSSNEPAKEHHYGRNAGKAGGLGAGGVAAYEAEKHLGHDDRSGLPSDRSDTAARTGGLPAGDTAPTSMTAGPITADPTSKGPGSAVPASTGPASTGPASTTAQLGREHYYARDAGIAGGVGAGGVAAYEAEKHLPHSQDRTQPPSASSTQQSYDTTPRTTGDQSNLKGASTTAGVGAAAGGISEKELQKQHEKEEKALEKQHAKEEKAHQKGLEKEEKHHLKALDKQHAKEEKAHQKDLEKEEKHHLKALDKQHAKEEKAHQKDIEKEEKHHQKELEKEQEKEEKHHQKELAKEEQHHQKSLAKEEKKHPHDDDKADKEKKHHGGILGLFHRDKPDDELKQEELARKEATGDHTNIPSMAEVDKSESEKHAEAKAHDRTRLHKDPPPGFYEEKLAQGDTSYAAPPKEGSYASQMTGGTGTTALAQGGDAPAGSHLSSTGNKMDPSVAEGYGEGTGSKSMTGTT